MSLQESLREVVDFRQRNKNFRHELLDILLLSVCAVLSGAEDYGEIALFGQKKEAFLRRFLRLPNGIPSHDTIRRVFMYLDEKAFNQAFINWVSYTLSGQYRHVSVDGKTLRGSYELDQPPIHLVSAVASELGISLGQWKVNEKSNEITAIPALLELLALKGCLVSIDAMGCQKAIAGQILDQGADYLLAVKDNQPTLLAQLQEQFQRGGVQQSYQFTDWAASHNQLVTYQVQVSHRLDWLENAVEWKGLASLVHVHTHRESGREDRFYISSVEKLSAQQAYQWTRGHWSVENQLHWQLDVTFREDDKRVRKEQAPENLSLLRKIALNLLQLEQSRKLSKTKKRKLAGWDEQYLIHLLSNASAVQV